MSSRQHAEGVAIGCTLAAAVYYLSVLFYNKRKVVENYCTDKKNLPIEADDRFQSLYYGPESYAGSEGAGFPLLSDKSCINKDILTTTHKEYKFLPTDMYKFAVEHLPIVSSNQLHYRHSLNSNYGYLSFSRFVLTSFFKDTMESCCCSSAKINPPQKYGILSLQSL